MSLFTLSECGDSEPTSCGEYEGEGTTSLLSVVYRGASRCLGDFEGVSDSFFGDDGGFLGFSFEARGAVEGGTEAEPDNFGGRRRGDNLRGERLSACIARRRLVEGFREAKMSAFSRFSVRMVS